MADLALGTIFAWGDSTRPPLPELVAGLRAAGSLPPGETWWFAWHEPAIRLPGRLNDLAELPADWDTLHLFSPQLEFRQVRRGAGWQWLLLSEAPLPDELASAWRRLGSYPTVPSRRILWGGRLTLPTPDAGVVIGRGVVAFPRRLDYEVEGEAERTDQALMAEVQLYLDEEARQQSVRYKRLYHLPVGDASATVESLEQVMGEL